MDHKTVVVTERDLVALAKIVHAAHDQRFSWVFCECPSCRIIRMMFGEKTLPGESWVSDQLEA